MPPRQRGTIVIRKRLGSELRRIREELNKRLDEVAAELEVSPSKISRLETGRAIPKVWDVRNLLTLYNVQDEAFKSRLIRWTNDAKADGWWGGYSDAVENDLEYYISLEAEAAAIQVYCAPILCGLLQTKAYAEAILTAMFPRADPKTIGQLVAVRMHRQEAITRSGEPVRLHVIADEACLRRVMGSREVMRDQLASLLERAELPHVTFQVYPLAAGAHEAIMSTFTIFVPRIEDLDPVVVNIESTKHDAYEERHDYVREFQAVFTDLSRRALDPAESRKMITQLMSD